MVQPNFSSDDVSALTGLLPQLFAGLEKSGQWKTHLAGVLRGKNFPSHRQRSCP